MDEHQPANGDAIVPPQPPSADEEGDITHMRETIEETLNVTHGSTEMDLHNIYGTDDEVPEEDRNDVAHEVAPDLSEAQIIRRMSRTSSGSNAGLLNVEATKAIELTQSNEVENKNRDDIGRSEACGSSSSAEFVALHDEQEQHENPTQNGRQTHAHDKTRSGASHKSKGTGPSSSLLMPTSATIHAQNELAMKHLPPKATKKKFKPPSERLMATTQSRVSDIKYLQENKDTIKPKDDIWWDKRKPAKTAAKPKNVSSKLFEPTSACIMSQRSKVPTSPTKSSSPTNHPDPCDGGDGMQHTRRASTAGACGSSSSSEATMMKLHTKKIHAESPLLRPTTNTILKGWNTGLPPPPPAKPELLSQRTGPRHVQSRLLDETANMKYKKYVPKGGGEIHGPNRTMHPLDKKSGYTGALSADSAAVAAAAAADESDANAGKGGGGGGGKSKGRVVRKSTGSSIRSGTGRADGTTAVRAGRASSGSAGGERKHVDNGEHMVLVHAPADSAIPTDGDPVAATAAVETVADRAIDAESAETEKNGLSLVRVSGNDATEKDPE